MKLKLNFQLYCIKAKKMTLVFFPFQFHCMTVNFIDARCNVAVK
jgi:hypothetical protein